MGYFMLVLLAFILVHIGTKFKVFERDNLLDCALEIWIDRYLLLV